MKTLILTDEQIQIISHALLARKISISRDSEINLQMVKEIQSVEIEIYHQTANNQIGSRGLILPIKS